MIEYAFPEAKCRRGGERSVLSAEGFCFPVRFTEERFGPLPSVGLGLQPGLQPYQLGLQTVALGEEALLVCEEDPGALDDPLVFEEALVEQA